MSGIDDVAAIRAAIKAQIDAANITIATSATTSIGLAVFDYSSGPTNLQYPCAIIAWKPDSEIGYQQTFGANASLSWALSHVTLTVECRVVAADGESAEKALDILIGLGTGSVFLALFSDPTFGGTVGNGTALTAAAPSLRTDGTTTYWSATYTLEIYARKA